MSKRQYAFSKACPKCGVGPGVKCLRADGTKRKSVHMARIQAEATIDSVKRASGQQSFYQSPEWRRLRYRVLVASSGCCAACGATASRGRALHVDHINPISRFPELALDERNLQVLCEDCNLGKGAHDQTDWRRA